MMSRLNEDKIKYVVLRNYDDLENVEKSPQPNIDLMVENYQEVVNALGAVPKFPPRIVWSLWGTRAIVWQITST